MNPSDHSCPLGKLCSHLCGRISPFAPLRFAPAGSSIWPHGAARGPAKCDGRLDLSPDLAGRQHRRRRRRARAASARCDGSRTPSTLRDASPDSVAGGSAACGVALGKVAAAERTEWSGLAAPARQQPSWPLELAWRRRRSATQGGVDEPQVPHLPERGIAPRRCHSAQRASDPLPTDHSGEGAGRPVEGPRGFPRRSADALCSNRSPV